MSTVNKGASSSVRTILCRLAVVVAIALVVAGGTYAISVSPASSAVVSAIGGGGKAGHGGPPQMAEAGQSGSPQTGRGGQAAPPQTAKGGQGNPSQASRGGQGGSSQGSPVAGDGSFQQMAGRPGGGKNAASLERGLPEFGMNAAVLAGMVVVFSSIRMGKRTFSRKAAEEQDRTH